MSALARRLLLPSALLLLAAGPGAVTPSSVSGHLAVEHDGERWTFVVQLEAQEAAEVQYELHSTVAGSAGRSRNQQRGRAKLEPGSPRQPARTTLRIRPEDAYCVTLRVLAQGALVASDRVASDPPPAADTGADDSCSE
jgi:hypothetical protein